MDLETAILQADPDKLMLALVKRGARTRALAGNLVSVTLKLPNGQQRQAERRQRQRRSDDELERYLNDPRIDTDNYKPRRART